MKKNLGSIITAIDIGTMKITVIIAQKIELGDFQILGFGKSESKGVSKGIVVDISEAVQSIKIALEEAQMMAGIKVENAIIGISGAHINSFNSDGMIPIKHGYIKEQDKLSVINSAKAIVIPEGQQIIHTLTQYYTIDGQNRVKDPLGMFGIRLEARVHIITGSINSIQNLIRCCQLAGVKVKDIILEPIASASAVLSNDEKNLGVALLDIGGGTSDLIIYKDGSVQHTKILPTAGNHITNDLALCLRLTLNEAERIKHQFGSCIPRDLQNIMKCEINQEVNDIDVEMIHKGETKKIYIDDIITIIEARCFELLYLLDKELKDSNLKNNIPAGLVITGGGSLLHGLKQYSTAYLNIPTRIGYPKVKESFKDLFENPIYSTNYGIIINTIEKDINKFNDYEDITVFNKIFWKMKSLISGIF
jgi:cell division protein FtsA